MEVSVNSFDTSEDVSLASPSDRDCALSMIYKSAMKRAILFLATWVISLGALAFTPDQYAAQVLQKDLPRSVRWFGKIIEAQQMNQFEVYNIYQAALPETQVNKQLGISVKGSIERMVLLLDGAHYFEQVQRGSLEYQNKKEVMIRILQATKDQMDRFQYGEDPQILLEEWKALGVVNIAKFAVDLVETFTETQKLLNSPAIAPGAQGVDVQETTDDAGASTELVENQQGSSEAAAVRAVAEPSPAPDPDSFETQRFNSYVQSAEGGKISGECQNAQIWKTDQAESCRSDETLECDRSYARQCKKLQ
jgi:hypothetical protein